MTVPTLANVLAEHRRMAEEDSDAAWLRRARQFWPQVFSFIDDLCSQASRIYGGAVSYKAEVTAGDYRMWPEDRCLTVTLSRGKTRGGELYFVFRDSSIGLKYGNRTRLRSGDTPEADAAWFTNLTEEFASACKAFGA